MFTKAEVGDAVSSVLAGFLDLKATSYIEKYAKLLHGIIILQAVRH